MLKKLLPLLALLLLTAQDCDTPEPLPPEERVSDYCHGNDYSISAEVEHIGKTIAGVFNSILMGEPSVDRRATVRVRFGDAYCSGVAISPNVVLTAGHCGYATNDHRILLGGYGSEKHESVSKVVHPDYVRWILSGNQDLEARKADLMLLFFDGVVPPPYVGGFYNPQYASLCHGLVAQGWGKWEGDQLSLRETEYIITDDSDPKYLKSRASQLPDGEHSGRICFGDSGGPLYADVNGETWLAGVTTTTMSADCMVGGTHVNVEFFKDWIVSEIQKHEERQDG